MMRRCLTPLNRLARTRMNVSLRPITAASVRAICHLATRADQVQFVAPNAVSLAQALFSPEAWYRAVYVDEGPAGFVMLYDESLRPQAPAAPLLMLWRFMIDARFQRQGIGRAALLQVIAHARAKAVSPRLLLSYVPGPGCPEPLYRQLGFRPTGEVDEGEVVMALALAMDDAASVDAGRTEGAKPLA